MVQVPGTAAIDNAETTVYALNYSNIGSTAAASVTLTATVPNQSVFNFANSSAGWSCGNGSPAGTPCTLTIGALAAGGSGSRNFAIQTFYGYPAPSDPGPIVYTACVADPADSTPANNCQTSSTPTTVAYLVVQYDSLVDHDANGVVSCGDELNMSVASVVSNGIGTNVQQTGLHGDIWVAPQLPDASVSSGWSLVGGSPFHDITTSPACDGFISHGASLSDLYMQAHADCVVDPTSGWIDTFRFRIAVGTSASSILVDGIEHTADGFNLYDQETVGVAIPCPPPAPDVRLQKTSSPSPVAGGQTLVSNLAYSNIGSATAFGVTLQETVPANTTFSDASSSPGWSCPDGSPGGTSCTLNIGTVTAGGSGNATFAAIVAAPIPAGVTSIGNSACATTTSADSDSSNNCSSTTTPTGGPNMRLTKTASPDPVSAGQTLVYTLNYSNIGDLPASGTVLVETVPFNTTFTTTGSSAGWTCANGAPAGTVCQLSLGFVTSGSSGSRTFAVVVASPIPAGVTQIANVACAHPTPGGSDLNAGNDCGGATTPISAPNMSLTKSAVPSVVGPGGTLVYTLAYANAGNGVAPSVVLSETVPANTTFTTTGSTAGWSCPNGSPAGTSCTLGVGSVPAGGSGSATFAVSVSSPIPAGVSQIGNSACARPTPASLDSNAANDCGSTTTPTGAPNMSLVKTSNQPSVGPGGTLIYTLAYANTGDLAAAGVVLSETVPANTTFTTTGSTAGWTCANGSPAGTSCTLGVGNVAAGGSGSATFAVVVASPIPAGVTQIGNSACARPTPTSGDSDPSNDCGSVTTPAGAPNMSLIKTAAPSPVLPGGTLTATLSYQNNGTATANAVVVTETVPANTSFTTAGSTAGWSCGNGSPAGTVCTLAVGNVAAGAGGTAAFAIVVASPLPVGVTQIGNTACADPTPPSSDSNTADDCGSVGTPVGGAPSLTMTKVAGKGIVQPGDVLIYTLTVTNTGNRAAAGVNVSETVPAHTTFVAASSSPGWSCADGSPAGTPCAISVGNIAGGGGTAAVQFAVLVDNPLPAGVSTIGNSACSADNGANGTDPEPNDNCDSTTTPTGGAPDLVVTKVPGSSLIDPGAVLTYTINVANQGNRDAANVTVSETVPVATSFVAGSSTPGWSCSDGAPAGSSCSFAAGNLAAGGSFSVTFTVQLATPLPSGTTAVNNTACANDDGSNGSDPTPANNCGQAVTPAGGAPSLAVTKSTTSTLVNAGDIISWDIAVTNNGNRDANAVRLQEIVPPGTTFFPGVSSSGWTCFPDDTAGSTCSYLVGTLAPAATAGATFAAQLLNPVPSGVTAVDNRVCVDHDAADGTDPDASDDCASTSTPVGGPVLAVTKTLTSGTLVAGGQLVYTITATNTGNGPTAFAVRLTDSVPVATTFDATASTAGWTCADGAGSGTACLLTLSVLAPGASVSAVFVVNVVSPLDSSITSIDNTACAADGSGAVSIRRARRAAAVTVCSTVTTPRGGDPELAAVKRLVSGQMVAGGTLVYAIDVTNNGTADAVGAVVIDGIPNSTTYSALDSTPGWSCISASSGDCSFGLPTIAPGATTTVNFGVIVVSPIPAGVTEIRNVACVNVPNDAISVNNCSTVVINPPPPGGAPDLHATKRLVSGSLVAGAVLVYAIDVTNNGSAAALAPSVTETVPTNSVFAASSSTAGWSCADGSLPGTSCVLALGAIAPGGSTSVNFAVLLPTPLPSSVTQIANTACAAVAGDPVPADDCSTVVVDPPGPGTDTDVEISLSEPLAKRTDSRVHGVTLSVRNTSTVDADNLNVVVTLPPGAGQPTGLDPRCLLTEQYKLECAIGFLAAGGELELGWTQPIVGPMPYSQPVIAEVWTEAPTDVDSVPGNGVQTEDDYALITLSGASGPGVPEVPTLSEVGFAILALSLAGFAVLYLRRRVAPQS